MATLANLVKNIDPPIELTQAQYDALSQFQKENGFYFITDGSGAFQTAATTPAQDSSGNSSDVQTELNKRLEISNIVNNGLTTMSGYALDARYGKLLNDTTVHYSQIANYNTPMVWEGKITTYINIADYSASNSPQAVSSLVFTSNNSANYSIQHVITFSGNAYTRTRNDSTYSNWIMTSGNYTSYLGALPTNANLNNYTTLGTYYASYAVGITVTNCPIKTSFLFKVESTQTMAISPGYIIQTIIPTSKEYGIRLTRRSINGGSDWSVWSPEGYVYQCIITDSNGNAAGICNQPGLYLISVTHPTDNLACWGGLIVRRKDGVPYVAQQGGNLITETATNTSGTIAFKYNNVVTAGLICNAYRIGPFANY